MRNIDRHDLAVRLAKLAYDYDYYDFIDSLDGDEDIEDVIAQNEKDLKDSNFIDKVVEWLEDEVTSNINWIHREEGKLDKRTRDIYNRAVKLINDLMVYQRENFIGEIEESLKEDITDGDIDRVYKKLSKLNKVDFGKLEDEYLRTKPSVKDAVYKFYGTILNTKSYCKDFIKWAEEEKNISLKGLPCQKNESLKEDTVKQGSHWVNKGKEGTHGKFKTKKAADAQRKAMFANSGKNRNFGEGLNEDFSSQIDWRMVRFDLDNMLGNVKVAFNERETSEGAPSIADFKFTFKDGTVVKCIMQGVPEEVNVIFPDIRTKRTCHDEYEVVNLINDLFFNKR